MPTPENKPPQQDIQPEDSSGDSSVIKNDREKLTVKDHETISGQWEQLKESVSLKDVILHPVARLSIFWHERQTAQAEIQLEDWKREEAITLIAFTKTNSGLEKSVLIRESLRKAQDQAGIVLDLKKFSADKRDVAMERAKVFQETRTNNLAFVREKVRKIEEKKSSFMQERDIARKVFIDSYTTKADVETKKISECDARILEVSGTVHSYEEKGQKLRQLIEDLEKENREDLLDPDDAEYLETMRQLHNQEYNLSIQLEKYSATRKLLTLDREEAVKQQEFWSAKIRPAKLGGTEDVPLVINPDTSQNEENDTETETISSETKEERPKSVKEAVSGLSAEIREAEHDEFSYAHEVLSDAQHAFAEKYPDSKMFTWIIWFFELFSDSVGPQKKSSQ